MPVYNPASEGFPYEKVDAARRYLHTVKPWWSRFGGHLKIVPSYREPEPGARFGAITSTDPQFRLYVDRTFAQVSSVEEIAGALQHEYQHHTHDTWRRLRWLTVDEWNRWANIALDLEINSIIHQESTRLSMSDVRVMCSRSALFSERELDRWGVKSPPVIESIGGWIPHLVKMPEGLSAESYLSLLQKSQDKKDRQDQEDEADEEQPDLGDRDDSEQGEGGEGDPGVEEGSQEPGLADGPQGAGDGQDVRDDAGGDEGTGEGQDGPQEGDPRSEGQESGQEGAAQDAPASGGDQGGTETPDQMLDGQPQPMQDEASGSGVSSEAATQQSPGQSAGDGQAPGGETSEPQPSAEIAEVVEAHMNTPEAQMWANEVSNPDDPVSQNTMKPDDLANEREVSDGEIEKAKLELEEDVIEAQYGLDQFGIAPGDRLAQWAKDRRAARRVNWESKFVRLTNALYHSSKIQGASDLSYSVPNPNQQEFGPILMGLHDYSPYMVVIQDVSYSMRMDGRMSRAQDVFTNLATKVLGRFGTQVNWITYDTQVQAVGKASSWNSDIEMQWSKGLGGTTLGPVISDVVVGRFSWRGKRLKKPDVTIIFTDCGFVWPEERPGGKGSKILVVSVGEEWMHDRYLPAWLNRRTELIVVD